MAAGATVVTLPRYSLAALLATVERYRVTVLAVPPPVMTALAGDPETDRHDLSSLQLIVSGGRRSALPCSSRWRGGSGTPRWARATG
jgi:acyl-coenzyme A synthetase/AMP-(fatty) acid ligase